MCVNLHRGKNIKHERFKKSILWNIIFFRNLEYYYLQKQLSIIFWILYKYKENCELVMEDSEKKKGDNSCQLNDLSQTICSDPFFI